MDRWVVKHFDGVGLTDVGILGDGCPLQTLIQEIDLLLNGQHSPAAIELDPSNKPASVDMVMIYDRELVQIAATRTVTGWAIAKAYLLAGLLSAGVGGYEEPTPNWKVLVGQKVYGAELHGDDYYLVLEKHRIKVSLSNISNVPGWFDMRLVTGYSFDNKTNSLYIYLDKYAEAVVLTDPELLEE